MCVEADTPHHPALYITFLKKAKRLSARVWLVKKRLLEDYRILGGLSLDFGATSVTRIILYINGFGPI
jgi:hypothetical protein